MILKEETLGIWYGQHLFASACFRPTKKARLSVVMIKDGRGSGSGAVSVSCGTTRTEKCERVKRLKWCLGSI